MVPASEPTSISRVARRDSDKVNPAHDLAGSRKQKRGSVKAAPGLPHYEQTDVNAYVTCRLC